MFYKNELDFLCDTLRKRHIRTFVVSLLEPVSSVIDQGLYDIFSNKFNPDMTVHQYVGTLDQHTLYKTTDEFKLCYIYFLLPSHTDQTSVFFMGPYRSAAVSSHELLELGENGEVRILVGEQTLSFERSAVAKINTYFEF